MKWRILEIEEPNGVLYQAQTKHRFLGIFSYWSNVGKMHGTKERALRELKRELKGSLMESIVASKVQTVEEGSTKDL